MKSISPYCICLIAIFALAVSPARANYHYASHEGSNEYPCTSWETAAHVIQDAVDAAEGGDTVYVGAGDYYQRAIIRCYGMLRICPRASISTALRRGNMLRGGRCCF